MNILNKCVLPSVIHLDKIKQMNSSSHESNIAKQMLVHSCILKTQHCKLHISNSRLLKVAPFVVYPLITFECVILHDGC